MLSLQMHVSHIPHMCNRNLDALGMPDALGMRN